jgi:hypothetical protein
MQFTYRWKNYMLLAASLALGVGSYFLSFQKTITLYQENIALEKQLHKARQAPGRIKQLETQVNTYRTVLKKEDSLQLETYTLERFSALCRKYKATLVSFPLTQTTEQDRYLQITRIVKIKGNFHNLLQILREAETNTSLGKITGIKFSLEEDRRTNVRYLYGWFYMQNLQLSGKQTQKTEP